MRIRVKALIKSKIAGARVRIVRIATTRRAGTRSSEFSESAILSEKSGIDPPLRLVFEGFIPCVATGAICGTAMVA
jgi:hypothetical protein